MKQIVLARPNLKLFLFGAVVLLLIQHFVEDVRSEGPMILEARATSPATAEAALPLLLDRFHRKPTADLCHQISYLYERQGNLRKALVFLRHAEILTEGSD